MGVTVHFKNSKLNVDGGFISTGIAKILHGLGHTKYGVVTQKSNHSDSITITAKYSTYFTAEVRRNGQLTSSEFDFTMIGDNYP